MRRSVCRPPEKLSAGWRAAVNWRWRVSHGSYGSKYSSQRQAIATIIRLANLIRRRGRSGAPRCGRSAYYVGLPGAGVASLGRYTSPAAWRERHCDGLGLQSPRCSSAMDDLVCVVNCGRSFPTLSAVISVWPWCHQRIGRRCKQRAPRPETYVRRGGTLQLKRRWAMNQKTLCQGRWHLTITRQGSDTGGVYIHQ